MIKKITLLTALFALSGCATYANNQCDPEKNYINSNPEAMDNYKELVKKGEVKSYYLKIFPTNSCINNKCLTYDNKRYDFQELYFDDSLRQGIYTIKVTSKDKDPECITIKYSSDKKCYMVSKNKNNLIKSRYYLQKNRIENTSYIKFTDLKNNIILFETSSQSYHIENISDAPSGYTCSVTKNPKYYTFNIFDYP